MTIATTATPPPPVDDHTLARDLSPVTDPSPSQTDDVTVVTSRSGAPTVVNSAESAPTVVDLPASCAQISAWIGGLCEQGGEPLSVTITGHTRCAYVHVPSASSWTSWCKLLAMENRTVNHDSLIGGMLTGVVYTRGWTVHVQLLGSPVEEVAA